ncbi:DNA/RNA-binding protein KIN17 isoform X1 [Bufo gargarizans]|uniref:DNA/RNA-binding protein KIN17 isoform X1 n=1 Tax=Bufo gargarizans TaxID=30331 RepID=UPI001CF23069|nr:DNA/RNA-binding protein KIN17 isoform X1 [Bufo gargarizans]
MGKADFLTPKAIANRIKSKGLQKLRWYCQMCQKQCRDENGFKCHCMSESHQRQLLLASENPQQFMDYFSEEFRNEFLELLKRRFGTKRVHNNIVYNEYISHREHIHMNATKWETLTDFTKWLGREGLCKVDETPKGWYVQYIDRDPETIKRQQELEKKKKQDLDDEERTAKFIEEQVKRGKCEKEEETPVYTELNRENEEEKVVFNLAKVASTSGSSSSKSSSSSLATNALKATAVTGPVKRKDPTLSQTKEKKKKSALEEIIEMEEKKKKTERTDYWLHPEIVVKIVTKKLGEKYYKKKAVIKEVIDRYTAIVKLVDSGDKLKLDQTHLETVIPVPGKQILILNGGYKGNLGILESIKEKSFSATIVIDSGLLKGRKVDISYEDFSKVA